MRRKVQTTLVALLLLSTGLTAGTARLAVAVPNPVATSDAELLAFGRVFPDPQGCLAFGASDSDGDGVKDTPDGVSPYAKGRVCVEQFLGYDEVVDGATFLQRKFPRFLQVIRLDQAYDNPEYKSAGIPTTLGFNEDGNLEILSRDRRPLYLFKITDAQSPIPERDRLHFAYSLSIHGIERAGVEGGIRAMEDLVTWAACEDDPSAAPACSDEGPFPKEIVETPTAREVPTAGEVLERSVIYFVPPNPDGWHRGELGEGGVYYQRYNGNGVDLNRDWPTLGYTYRPYSPGSEPETRAYSEVLKGIRGVTSGDRFAGGIDLHGQILAVAFSFTLIGAGQRDFRKNFSTVDQSLRAWEDQTQRLGWSPYIADANQNGQNDAGESCPVRNVLVTSGNFPYCFADQWGTVVDTIGYQITGGVGDWFDSPIGLNGVGIDNEMSMSHILPNNLFDPINEQMHVDGNKGLIYSQLASMLTEEDADFVYEPPGRIGYVFDPRRVEVEASDRPQNPGYPAQNDIDTLLPCTSCQGGTFVMDGLQPTLEFDVLGPDVGIFNGGITVQATFTNVDGIGTGSIPRLKLERFDEEGGGQWLTVASSFVQAQTEGASTPDLYAQSGQVVTANDPVPGRWRVRLTSLDGSPTRVEVDFRHVTAEASPGQAAISASSMDFFDDLNRYVPEGQELVPVTVDEILADPSVLDGLDSLVVVDDFMPEFVGAQEAPFSGDPQATIPFSFGPEATVVGTNTFEFEVLGPPDADNDLMFVRSSWVLDSDWDIYVERQRDDGTWEERGCQCSFIAKGENLTVTVPEAGTWRVRLENFAAVPQPVQGTIEFSSDPAIPDPGESRYTAAQFDEYTEAVGTYAARGGNLILTDGALGGLESLGLVEPGLVGSSQPGGRGAVPRFEMNVSGRGNLCTPDTPDPLLGDVCLPGTAGGTARQVMEPAPIGYTPDATQDGAARAKLTQYYVDRAAWEADCGKDDVAECTSALLGAGVGLGERHVGRGVIRIAGAMLPDPNYAPGGPRDMRFGLGSYSLTFAGWQVFLNLVDYVRPAPLPDLVVTDISTPVKVRGGRKAPVMATIANVGLAEAGPSTTEFVLDGQTELGSIDTAAIPAGGTTEAVVTWKSEGNVQGEHTITATADVLQAVAEEVETNNAGVLTFQIKGNKIKNGSFEQANSEGNAPEGWTASDTGAGETSWSGEGTDGSQGAAITGTGGSVLLSGAPTWTSDAIEVSAGEVLDLVLSVSTDGASSAPTVSLAYLGAAGEVLSTVRALTAPLSTAGFVDLEQTITVPAGVTAVRVVLTGFAPTDTRTAGTVVFDDVGLYAA
ncbi:MAG: hypothetical protein HY658_00325 [Actinobacteria bacterium]|nr:hypothetical protein [Actinomycetota bacterium]